MDNKYFDIKVVWLF